MPEAFYRTGQVAKALGTSSHHIRRLCETNQIQAEVTEGQQWKIPLAELQRLQKTGVPPIPERLEPHTGRARPGSNSPTPGLLAPPSEAVVSAAEEVVITENLVKRRKLERELEEAEDWFREREQQEVERRAEQEAERQERVHQERAEQERERCLLRWERYALDSLPWNAPPEVKLELHRAVRERLAALDPMPAGNVTQALVDALVAKALADWRRRANIEKVLIEARDQMLPSQARGLFELTAWQIQAVKAASAAISQLRNNAPLQEIRAVAKQAVEKIAADYELFRAGQEDSQMRQSIIRWTSLPDALTDEGKELATQAVAGALAKQPMGMSRRELERVREEALAPFHAAVVRVQQEARKQAEEARRLSDAESRVRCRLAHVYDCLTRLEGLEGEEGIEFADFTDHWDTAEKLKKTIQPILVQELLRKPDLTDAQIQERIEKLVDQHLDAVLTPA